MAVNQLVNAASGGDPDMSISARAAYAREHGSQVGKCFCAFLELMDVHVVNDKRAPGEKIPGDHCFIARYNQEHEGK